MLIFAENLRNEKFFWFRNDFVEGINCFEYDQELISKAQTLNKNFAIYIKNKDEIFLANALGAQFIFTENEKLAKFASKAGEFYLFDSKILFLIQELKNLKKAFKLGVDGVLMKNFIK